MGGGGGGGLFTPRWKNPVVRSNKSNIPLWRLSKIRAEILRKRWGGGIKWEGGGSLYKPNATLEGPRFDPLLLSFLFKTCGLWTLSCDFAHTIHETLKCLIQLPALTLSQSGGDSEASKWKDIGTYHPLLPHTHTHTHPSPRP